MTKRKDYRTSIYIGTDANGKKLYKTISAPSPSELKKKKAAMVAARDKNFNLCDKGFFSVWSEKFYTECKRNSGLCAGTLTQYRSAISHLDNAFGDMEMKDITLSAFQCFVNELAAYNPNTGKPSSKATLRSIIKVAAAIFTYADSNNILGVPKFISNVSIPKSAPCNPRYSLSEEEIQWIIDTPHRAQLPAMICLFAGLRRGEMMALKWDDINFDKKTLKVQRSVEIIGNKSIVKDGGKSAAATRTIPMPPILADYLKEYRKSSSLSSPYVCTNASGNMLTKSSLDRMWDSYMLDLNIKYGYDNNKSLKYNPKRGPLPMLIKKFGLHHLRHTYATLLYLMGIDPVDAKKYLGHSSISVTIDIYTDLERFDKSSLSKEFKDKLKNEFAINIGVE